MDKIINYLLLTIIFVFDPLAISLVIAANFAFEKLRPKTRDNIYGEKVLILEEDPDPNDLPDIDEGMWTEEEMEDFNNQFNADDLLPDEDNQLEFDFNNPLPEVLKANKRKDILNKIKSLPINPALIPGWDGLLKKYVKPLLTYNPSLWKVKH